MFQILLLNKISNIGTDLFDRKKFNLVNESFEPDGILLRSFELNGSTFSDNLKAIGRAGAGVNNIPVSDCTNKGIVVFNTPGANANGVKELVISALMLSSRKIIEGVNWVNSLKNSESIEKLVEKGKSNFAGKEIANKTIGIIGLGAIGVLVANACNSLGMEVIGYDPFISVNAAWNLSRGIKRATSLEELYSNSDFISLHIPLVDSTKEMINKVSIGKMKDNIKILNFARAGLVNNYDLIEAVETKKIASYVTDFPQSELIGVENIICIPHLGASTEESEENCAEMAANEIIDYLENGNIKNSVNFPDCELPVTNFKRICIINKNIPDVIGGITRAISSKDINIEHMINKSKGDYSYNIIEVDSDDLHELEKDLLKVQGIIKIRII